MDTSILSTLREIAPDLMAEIELRTLILERVAALEPIGRRALAARLHLAEREVRAAADALKASGCIAQSAAGMELTAHGQSLVQAARTVSAGRRTLSSVELALARKLGVERVRVVRGDADREEDVPAEAARMLAQEIRFLSQDAHVLAVSGGALAAQTARAVTLAAPMDVTVVPAQGCTLAPMDEQANAVAQEMAARLGGQSRTLHLPEGVSQQALDALAHLPQVRAALELLWHADVLIYEAKRAGEHMAQIGAAAELLGLYLNAKGEEIGGRALPALRIEDMGGRLKTAAVAVGSASAEAIMAACAHHAHRLLVTDEGAAQKLTELLRV